MGQNDNANNICRICLEENNEEIQCVFNTNESTGKLLQFSEMLMACASVQVILGDGLPEQICSNCAQDTIKSYLFKLKCEESDKVLRIRENSFILIDKIEINEEDILRKIKSEIRDDNVEESELMDFCVQQSPSNFLKNIVSEEKGDVTANSLSSIQEKTLEGDTSQNESIGDDLNLVPNHSRKDTYESEFSEFCKTKFPQRKLLTTNRKRNPYECEICKMKFSHKELLEVHKRIHTKKVIYECEFCDITFSQLAALTNHRRIHTQKQPIDSKKYVYECEFCRMKFPQSELLQKHKSIHTGQTPYECDFCQAKFSYNRTLSIHRRTHTGKTYECGTCKMQFSQYGSLAVHRRIHSGKHAPEDKVSISSSNLLNTIRYRYDRKISKKQ